MKEAETTTSTTASPSPGITPAVARTARTTGMLYLGMIITGVAGSLVVRAQLFADGDPSGTLSNLLEHKSLARLGIALELGVVLAQALTALWFYRLFRRVDAFAASSLALFGIVNAVAILGSAALLATALEVAGDPSLAVKGGSAATVQLLYVASGHLWGVAGMFFGLWLIPMGSLVLRSGWLPRLLGWFLIVGGMAYVVSAVVDSVFSTGDLVSQLLTVPATIGEFWIIGYLVIVGVRSRSPKRGMPAAPGGAVVHGGAR